MNKITELLKDRKYAAELLNGPCRPKNGNSGCAPINPDWIDETVSDAVPEVSRRLLPEGIPYIPYVIAERNPDTSCDGTSVDSNDKRMRYFVIMVIPDSEYPFNYSMPLINELWRCSLNCWEITRACIAAATNYQFVKIANDAVPPILNNAIIQWVTLYLGRKPYRGISLLSEQWADGEEFDGYEADTNLYKIREMEQNPLLQKLIAAYDEDFPDTECEDSGNKHE